MILDDLNDGTYLSILLIQKGRTYGLLFGLIGVFLANLIVGYIFFDLEDSVHGFLWIFEIDAQYSILIGAFSLVAFGIILGESTAKEIIKNKASTNKFVLGLKIGLLTLLIPVLLGVTIHTIGSYGLSSFADLLSMIFFQVLLIVSTGIIPAVFFGVILTSHLVNIYNSNSPNNAPPSTRH